MYVLFSFSETLIIIPQCWGGLFVTLAKEPTIVGKLPSGLLPNSQVCINQEKSSMQNNGNEKTYDYYFNCGTASKHTIEKALKNFNDSYKNKPPLHLVGNDYPQVNPVVGLMKSSLQEALRSESSHSFKLFQTLKDCFRSTDQRTLSRENQIRVP